MPGASNGSQEARSSKPKSNNPNRKNKSTGQKSKRKATGADEEEAQRLQFEAHTSPQDLPPDEWSLRMQRLAMWEGPVLLGMTVLNCVALLLMVTAVFTQSWAIMEYPLRHANGTQARVYTGIWRCRSQLSDEKNGEVQHCALSDLFIGEDHVTHDKDIDKTLKNYSQSEHAFAVISILMMCLGFIFSCYTLRHPQDIMKKMSAFLHLSSAVSALVLVQVFQNGLAFEKKHVPMRHPQHSTYSFGYSYGIVWPAMIFCLIQAIVFFVYAKMPREHHGTLSKSASFNDDLEAPMHMQSL